MSKVVWAIAILTFSLVDKVDCAKSRITFVNNQYHEIVVAIHPDTHVVLCPSIIGNITSIFTEAGSTLFTATNGEAAFGSINILLPRGWESYQCGLAGLQISQISPAKAYHSYAGADFKISLTQPIAKTLPWTKQYKSCESESEAVYLPLQFLMDLTSFDLRTKGKLLAHEWTKFRYGVFEEFGYFDDTYFSPCYARGGKQYFTSCTNTVIDDISTNGGQISPSECRSLIAQNTDRLNAQLRGASSSMLFAPHLGNINGLCSNLTHNGLSPTRQNVFCERRSTSEVIFAHQDFKIRLAERTFPNNRVQRPGSIPQFNILTDSPSRETAFAFIIEDTPDIRAEGKLEHVKQGITQMFRLLDDKSRTRAAVYGFDGVFSTTSGYKHDLTSSASKTATLQKIPGKDVVIQNFDQSFDFVFQDLARDASLYRWNIIFVTSRAPTNLPAIMELFRGAEYPVSVLTFGSSKDWLNFYSIPNTREVIFLPHCHSGGNVCHGRTSSIIADHLIQYSTSEIRTQRRYIQKVLDVNLAASSGYFQIVNTAPDASNFTLHMPVYNDGVNITVRSPFGGNNGCPAFRMLEYNVLEIQNNPACPYTAGSWSYQIEGHPPNVPVNYNLRGYVETASGERALEISAELGQKLEAEVFPIMNTFPVYVSVMTKEERPVINATVEIEVDFEGLAFVNSRRTSLYDNGIDPDLTADDGIYSTFLTTFSSTPAYHTLQVHVGTVPGTSKAIETLRSDTFEAALLDSRMSSKCCGSKVPHLNTIDMEYSSYTLTLPSFRTGEDVDPNRDFIPPSKIYTPIILIADEGSSVMYEFAAPGSDNNVGRVNHYSICCTTLESANLDDTMCDVIPIGNCVPVDAGSTQRCRIIRGNLVAHFFNNSSPGTGTTLYCGFRGVDNAQNNGPISSFLVDIVVKAEDRLADGATECNSISDDCLPIEVFWGLVACIGGLILIIIIVVIIWCCTMKKTKNNTEKKKQKQANEVTTVRGTQTTESLEPEPLRNVFINQAYIQDADGQLKLVASDGHLFPTPVVPERELENNRFPPVVGVRKRSSSSSDISPALHTFKSQPENPGSQRQQQPISWNSEPAVQMAEKDKDMPIFFSNRQTVASTNNNPTVNQKNLEPSDPRRHTTAPWENNQPSTFSRVRPAPPNILPLRTMEPNEPPIYASVQRFGRRTVNIEPINVQSPMNHLAGARGTGQFSPSYSSPKSFSKPEQMQEKLPARESPIGLAAAAKPGGFSQDYSIRSRPPVRMDHFPSSESEAYSDMSHILPRLAVVMNQNQHQPPAPPLPPPPVPVTAPPAPKNLERQSAMTFPPTPMARAPSKDTPTPAGVKTPELSRPKTFPPPPPPPRQFRNNTADEDDEYDDDSDNWDNYDDFEFTPPGTSFA